MDTGAGFAKGAPERGAGSPNGLTEGFTRSVYEQTPLVSLTLNHLPFQGRQGRFAPGCVPFNWVLAKIRGYWRLVAAPTEGVC